MVELESINKDFLSIEVQKSSLVIFQNCINEILSYYDENLVLQKIVSYLDNLSLTGVMILLERRFSIGDVIRVSGEAEGIVEKIGFRSTLIRQFDSNLVMIPNFK